VFADMTQKLRQATLRDGELARVKTEFDRAKGELSLARAELLPHLRKHVVYDLRKLRTYQGVQVLLLIAVLLGWGFGRRPDGEEVSTAVPPRREARRV